jgi:hypothetical protein
MYLRGDELRQRGEEQAALVRVDKVLEEDLEGLRLVVVSLAVFAAKVGKGRGEVGDDRGSAARGPSKVGKLVGNLVLVLARLADRWVLLELIAGAVFGELSANKPEAPSADSRIRCWQSLRVDWTVRS